MEEHGLNFPEPPPDLIEGEKEYEVEHIINMRHFGRNKKLQYKVRWKGYSEAHDSWEPVSNIPRSGTPGTISPGNSDRNQSNSYKNCTII
jgi:hypothetical protein